MSQATVFCLTFLLLLQLSAPDAFSHTRDYAVEMSAIVQEAPPQIDFSWPASITSHNYYVYKKSISDTAWGDPIAVLDTSAVSFTDFDVTVGEAYEYAFRKTHSVIRDTIPVTGDVPLIFRISDTYSDGICCQHGLGEYVISCDGSTYVAGGEFGASETTSFTPTGDEIAVSLILDVYANETTWILTDSTSGDTLAEGGPYEMARFGHIFAGIRYPVIEDRGGILILVTSSVDSALTEKLERLDVDMIADGYHVVRRVVSVDDAVPAVKQLILDECMLDPSIESILLIGNVPVPYSGDIRSAHTDHQGAWPADLYYAVHDAVWTDLTVNNTSATRPANRNVPGDGKFDQTVLPSDVDMKIGRIDLSNMGTFTESELELTERYLDKNHAYRRGELAVVRRGLVDDNVGQLHGTAFAGNGWRNFATMFGSSNVIAGVYYNDLEAENYLWSYGCGGGGYSSCAAIAVTADFATRPIQTVFTMLYGSYFGDWDHSNSLLRAPLAAETHPLACFWAGKPAWHLHHMPLGHSLGYSTRLSQNNREMYTVSDGGRQIHVALMGDPTLEMHIVDPPDLFSLSQLPGEEVELTWSPSADTVEGYYVYRAEGLRETFTRISDDLVTDTTFVDPSPPSCIAFYMVRAMKLETSGSGTYYNLSAGDIGSVGIETDLSDGGGMAPGTPQLSPSSPNPFNPETTIRYYIPTDGHVTLSIYNVSGRKVRTLVDDRMTTGSHSARWNGKDNSGRDAASGVYLYTLRSGDWSATRRMVLLR